MSNMDVELGKLSEQMNGKPAKKSTIGSKRGPNWIKIKVISDHPDANNAIVYKWVEKDKATLDHEEFKKAERAIKHKEKEIARKKLIADKMDKMKELEKQEKELDKRLSAKEEK